jgi:hypothetical protein
MRLVSWSRGSDEMRKSVGNEQTLLILQFWEETGGKIEDTGGRMGDIYGVAWEPLFFGPWTLNIGNDLQIYNSGHP